MQPVPSLPAVEYGQRTDPGRDPAKQVNEDACDRRETRFGHLCVVCDGMGGHTGGREASELALATIFGEIDAAPGAAPPAQVLRSAIEEANRRVHVLRTSEVGFGHPGSTVVAVLAHAGGTEVAHVGDSRAYLVHEGAIFRLTRDHSIVQELVDHGLITQQQAAHHPDANRITRALGIAPEVEVELTPQSVPHAAGDTFILCSDGLSDLVEDPEILAAVLEEPPAQAASRLVDLANVRGGHDNITVAVLRCRESAAAPVASPEAFRPPAPPQAPPGVTPPPPSVGLPQAPYAAPIGSPLAPPTPFPPPAIAAPGPTPGAFAASQAPAPPPSGHTLGIPLPPRSNPAPGLPLAAAPTTPALSFSPRPVPGPPASAAPPHPLPFVATIPPAPERVLRAAPRPPALVLVGLGLAMTAVLLLGAVLVVHVVERSGKRNAATEPPSTHAPEAAVAAATNAATSAVAPTAIAPERVEIPSASAAAEPIAPLEPTPAPAKKRKTHRHTP